MNLFIFNLLFIPVVYLCTTNHDKEITNFDTLSVHSFSISSSNPTFTFPYSEQVQSDFPIILATMDTNPVCLAGKVYWEFDDKCPSIVNSYGSPWTADTSLSVPTGTRSLMVTADFAISGEEDKRCEMTLCTGSLCTQQQCKPLDWAACEKTFDACSSDPCACIRSYQVCSKLAGCFAGSLVNEFNVLCDQSQCLCPFRQTSAPTSPETSPNNNSVDFFDPASPYFAAFVAGISVFGLFVILCLSLMMFCCFCGKRSKRPSRSRRGTRDRGGARSVRRGRRSTRSGTLSSESGGVSLSPRRHTRTASILPPAPDQGPSMHQCSLCGHTYEDQDDFLMHLGLRHPELARNPKQLEKSLSRPQLL